MGSNLTLRLCEQTTVLLSALSGNFMCIENLYFLHINFIWWFYEINIKI